jgi:putative transcriptional regulator
MSNIKAIRTRLGVTQTELAKGVGCTQGNVGHYERGQGMPPDVAKRLIAFAATRGHQLRYDDIYGDALSNFAQPAAEAAAGQGA